MKQRNRLIALVLILAAVLLIAAVPYIPPVWLKANQTVTIHCIDPTGEMIITPNGEGEVDVTCRVWVGRGERRP